MSISGVEGVMNSKVWQSIVLWVCGNRMMRLREDAAVLGREGVVVWPKEGMMSWLREARVVAWLRKGVKS